MIWRKLLDFHVFLNECLKLISLLERPPDSKCYTEWSEWVLQCFLCKNFPIEYFQNDLGNDCFMRGFKPNILIFLSESDNGYIGWVLVLEFTIWLIIYGSQAYEQFLNGLRYITTLIYIIAGTTLRRNSARPNHALSEFIDSNCYARDTDASLTTLFNNFWFVLWLMPPTFTCKLSIVFPTGFITANNTDNILTIFIFGTSTFIVGTLLWNITWRYRCARGYSDRRAGSVVRRQATSVESMVKR